MPRPRDVNFSHEHSNYKTLKNIYKVTRKQYSKLADEDGVIGSGDGAHRFDPDALYLVEDVKGTSTGGGSGSGFVDGVMIMEHFYEIKYIDEFGNSHLVIRTSTDDGDIPAITIGDTNTPINFRTSYLKNNNNTIIDASMVSSDGDALAGTIVARPADGQIDSQDYRISDEGGSQKAGITFDSTLNAIKFNFIK